MVVLQKLFILSNELLDLQLIQELMGESAIVSFVTEASGVDPFAWKLFGLVRVLALTLTSLTIILHEVFAQVVLEIVGRFHWLARIGPPVFVRV